MAWMIEDRRVTPAGMAARRASMHRRPGWRARSNLPAPLTSFVGRAQDVAALAERLGTTRLLTLTGVGGIGKSRLALEVARVVLGRGTTEVWLVELAGTFDPTHVPGAVAAVLGVRDSGERPLAETLADSLGDRQVLLLLDNCEHLATATADLTLGLLRDCPGVRVLATSRVLLGLSGETDWRVAPLARPEPERLPARTALTRYSAVRLFVERGRAARSDFALTERNATDVVRVCARLDGLPLAIELAAAHLKLLTPAEILAGLDDRFTLLVARDRAALPRHRALRATLDWSYNLLGDAERDLFRHLAPFVGGWSLDDARALWDRNLPASTAARPDLLIESTVTPSPPSTPIHDPTAFQLLSQLVEHSLVVVEHHDQVTRYRFLETVQRYAEERLEESGEAAEARGRHLTRMLDLAQGAWIGLMTSEQPAWCERLDADLDNIWAALAWACEAPLTTIDGPLGTMTALEAALQIAGLPRFYWCDMRGLHVASRAWLERLLALDDAVTGGEPRPTLGRIAAVSARAYIAFSQLDVPTAWAGLIEAERLARAVGERFEEMFARASRAHVALMRGEPDEAVTLADTGLDLARQLDPPLGPFGLGGALYWRGEVALALGETDRAATLFDESVAVARRHNLQWGLSVTLGGIAKVAMREGDYARAASALRESIATFTAIHDPRGLSWSLEQAAWTLAALDRVRDATLLLGAAAGLFRRLGMARAPFPHWDADRARATDTSREGLGAARFAAAYAEGLAMPVDRAVELALRSLSPGQATPSTLSRREMEIADLVASGLTSRQIAAHLVIQERTVVSHLQHIFRKLGLSNRVQLAAWTLDRRRPDTHPGEPRA
jgi:non-specific serine/threonine protein kinase